MHVSASSGGFRKRNENSEEVEADRVSKIPLATVKVRRSLVV